MKFVIEKIKKFRKKFLEFRELNKIKRIHAGGKISSTLLGLFEERAMRNESVRLYYGIFGILPSLKVFTTANTLKLIEHINKKYSESILFIHKREGYNAEKSQFEVSQMIYVLKNNIIIELTYYTFDANGDDYFSKVYINYNQNNENEAMKITTELLHFKEIYSTKNFIYLIIPVREGLDKKSIEIKKPKMKMRTHYNDDLIRMHLNILKKLKAERESGLFLFYGQPGIGKSTYIRRLIHSIKKNVIFISPNLAGNLDSPVFTKFLIDNPNSIFVIEDAENLIVSRDSENNSAISMILNLTDGLLGEGLGIQFICTFNTHLSRIDRALLRKGRLKALYEFGALTVDKSNYLLKSLNLEYETNKPMTLAEIYNLKEEKFDFDGEKRVIGFAA